MNWLNKYKDDGKQIEEGVLSAAGPWATLAGGLISGIGSGMSASDQLDFEKQKEEERKREAMMQMAHKNEVDTRSLGFKGIDALAQMRDEAAKNYRFQSFRDGVLSGGK